MTFCYTSPTDAAKTNTSILADGTAIHVYYLVSPPYFLLWSAIYAAQFKEFKFLWCSHRLLLIFLCPLDLLSHKTMFIFKSANVNIFTAVTEQNQCIQSSNYRPYIYIWYPSGFKLLLLPLPGVNVAIAILWDL